MDRGFQTRIWIKLATEINESTSDLYKKTPQIPASAVAVSHLAHHLECWHLSGFCHGLPNPSLHI